MKEQIKRILKNCLPWRLRYYIKLQEAKGNIHIAEGAKQFRGVKEYNNQLYMAMSELAIRDFKGKTVCELGPGQHLSHALLEYQLGAKSETLLEIADFAHVERTAVLDKMWLDESYTQVRHLPDNASNDSWKEYLKKINAQYSIDGLNGYKKIPDCSVDYCFSFYVFEHIRKIEFEETMREMFRFMAHGGICYHTVDFKDHLGGRKNHLRFPESKWEDSDHYKMDNYTNRLSCTEICEVLREVGFDKVIVTDIESFAKAPIDRQKISADLDGYSDEDLKMATAVIIAEKG